MDTQVIQINGRRFEMGDEAVRAALGRVYGTPERPRCLCVDAGVEMYVAKCRDYVVKRMPQTGPLHHPSCPSYEPPAGSSGLDELLGEAIVEPSPGAVELYLDFPFSRRPGKATPRSDGEPSANVTAPRQKMSLRALTEFLWHRAGFDRWYPAMQGKRSWSVIQRHLLGAADDITTTRGPLSERLFLPEPFREESKADIADRRRLKLALLHAHEEDGAGYKMAMVIGELKDVAEPHHGRRLVIKHMADCPLFISERTWKRAERTFDSLFSAHRAAGKPSTRLIMAALIYAKQEFVYEVDTITFIMVMETWVPVNGADEVALVQALQQQSRRFIKPLRYDAKAAARFPNAILLDTGAVPTPLHIASALWKDGDRAAKEKAIKSGGETTWVWHTEQPMPDLPPSKPRTVATPRIDDGAR